MGVHVFTDLKWVYGAIMTSLIWGVSGSRITQISDEQQPAAIKIEVSIGAHMVFPLSLGIGRENRWEFMCLQSWKGFMEP